MEAEPNETDPFDAFYGVVLNHAFGGRDCCTFR